MSGRVWIRLGAAANIPIREGRVVSISGREIAIFNLGDQFLAVDNRCPHRGGPLADGIIAGNAVVCPLHGWKVRLDTGEIERPAGCPSVVRSYPVRLDRGVVFVALPAADAGVPASQVEWCHQ